MKTKIYKDVVKKMRLIRDDLNIEIMNMTFEEEKAYLKSKLNTFKSNHFESKTAS